MKTNGRSVTILFAFAVILTLASASFAQKVGGYKVVAKTDPDVTAAADFAVEAQSQRSEKGYQLEEIVKAERQVVQGSNYRLCLEVSADGSDTFFVQAIVYVDLKGNKNLTSWVDSNCGGSSAAPAIKRSSGEILVYQFGRDQNAARPTRKLGLRLPSMAPAERNRSCSA